MALQVFLSLAFLTLSNAIFYCSVMRIMDKQIQKPNDQHEPSEKGQNLETPSAGIGNRVGSVGRSLGQLISDPLLVSVVTGVFLVDQVSKYFITRSLSLYDSWPADSFVRFVHSRNTGTAFGLFPDQTTVLIIASLLAIVFLFYFYRTQAFSNQLLRLAIGLQLGGAFGNLIDRIDDGAVVDFIDVGWWPIFNLADSSITIGVAILIGVITLGAKDASKKTTPAVDEREETH